MERLSKAVAAFVCLSQQGVTDPDFSFHRVIATLHQICAEIASCEKSGVSRTNILHAISKARIIHSQSPFVRRLQEWPRGYPGDFETIEYLINSVNQASDDTITHFVEKYALGCMAAQQHRNKVAYQAEQILETIFHSLQDDIGNPRTKPKILIIACGSSPDVRSILPILEKHDFSLVLNDADSDALEFSAARLHSIADKCIFVKGNILKINSRIRELGPFNLIVAGGLCDYLVDRQVSFLVEKVALKALDEDGTLFLTNIAKGNPFREWIEYFADWQLYERTEAQLSKILCCGDLTEQSIQVFRDKTGLTLLAKVKKQRVKMMANSNSERFLRGASRSLTQTP